LAGWKEPAGTVRGGPSTNKLSEVKAASNEEKLKLEIDNVAVPGLSIRIGRAEACGVVIPTADGPRSIDEGGVVLKPGVA